MSFMMGSEGDSFCVMRADPGVAAAARSADLVIPSPRRAGCGDSDLPGLRPGAGADMLGPAVLGLARAGCLAPRAKYACFSNLLMLLYKVT
jgi:hypothetical protein